jgi:hypothetical protein
MTRLREGKVTVTSDGQTYVASYVIDGRLMKVTSGGVSKSAKLGIMVGTPEVVARVVLGEMIRENHGQVAFASESEGAKGAQ